MLFNGFWNDRVGGGCARARIFFFFLMNLAIATPFISDVIFNIAHFKEIEEHVK